jgi:hypothetical protein
MRAFVLVGFSSLALFAQAPGGLFGVGGSSASLLPEYPYSFTGSTSTVTGTAHGRGLDADISRCETQANPHTTLAFTRSRDATTGDIAITLTAGSAAATCYVGSTSASVSVATTGMIANKVDKPGSAGVVTVDGSGNSGVVAGTGTNCVLVNGTSTTCASGSSPIAGTGISVSGSTVSINDAVVATETDLATGLATKANTAHTHTATDVVSGSKQGTGTKFQMAAGTPATGVCVEYDANGNSVPAASGQPCGSTTASLSALTDTAVSGPSDKDAMFFNSATSKWTKRTMAGGPTGCIDLTTPWNPEFNLTCLPPQAFAWTGYHDFSGGKVRMPESALGSLPTASSNVGKRYYVTPAVTPTFNLPCVSGDCIATASGYVSLNPRSDTWGNSIFTTEDEFVSGTTANGTIGALGWSLTSNGSITSQTHVNGDRNHPGIFRFGVASATVTGEHVMWAGSTAAAPHFSGLQTTSGWELQFRVRFPTTNQSALTEAGTQYWVGIGSMTGAISATAVPTDGFFAHFTSGANGPWSLETWKAGAADAASQSSSSGNLALGTWYTIRIRSISGNDGTVLISVNAGSGFETEKSFAVTSTTSLAPMVIVQSTAATTTSGLPRQLDIDSFRFAELVTRY